MTPRMRHITWLVLLACAAMLTLAACDSGGETSAKNTTKTVPATATTKSEKGTDAPSTVPANATSIANANGTPACAADAKPMNQKIGAKLKATLLGAANAGRAVQYPDWAAFTGPGLTYAGCAYGVRYAYMQGLDAPTAPGSPGGIDQGCPVDRFAAFRADAKGNWTAVDIGCAGDIGHMCTWTAPLLRSLWFDSQFAAGCEWTPVQVPASLIPKTCTADTFQLTELRGVSCQEAAATWTDYSINAQNGEQQGGWQCFASTGVTKGNTRLGSCGIGIGDGDVTSLPFSFVAERA